MFFDIRIFKRFSDLVFILLSDGWELAIRISVLFPPTRSLPFNFVQVLQRPLFCLIFTNVRFCFIQQSNNFSILHLVFITSTSRYQELENVQFASDNTLRYFKTYFLKPIIRSALWFASQGLWLLPAYFFEMEGRNSFLWMHSSSIVHFATNIFIACQIINHYQPIHAKIKRN